MRTNAPRAGYHVVGLTRVRDASRRLVVEVTAVGLLAAVATTTLPRQHQVDGWDFSAPVVMLMLHALLGLLVVVDGTSLIVTASWTAVRDHVFWPALGLAGVLVALAAGLTVLVGVPSGPLWLPMAVGWLAALTAYVAEWRGAARSLRALQPAIGRSGRGASRTRS